MGFVELSPALNTRGRIIKMSNSPEHTNRDHAANGKKTQVYLMQDTTNNFYKIGCSKQPRYREKTLQSEKPTIELLFCFEGSRKDEKYLHECFKEKRIRGEWFRLDDNDILYFKEYAGKIVKPWDCYHSYELPVHIDEERLSSEKPEKFKCYEWGTDEYKAAHRERFKDEYRQ